MPGLDDLIGSLQTAQGSHGGGGGLEGPASIARLFAFREAVANRTPDLRNLP